MLTHINYRYYSIASTEAGDDNGTLDREMRTYYNPRNAGIIQIFDSTLPNDRVALSRFAIPDPSLNIVFLPLGGNPNRFAAEFTDATTPFLVSLPLRVETRHALLEQSLGGAGLNNIIGI